MNQSEFHATARHLLKAREKSRTQSVIGLGFVSHWLKNWRERSNHNRVIISTVIWKTSLKYIFYNQYKYLSEPINGEK